MISVYIVYTILHITFTCKTVIRFLMKYTKIKLGTQKFLKFWQYCQKLILL